MKKARIALTAIVVMGIVGGTVAFKVKATTFGTKTYYTTGSDVSARNTVLDAETVNSGTSVYWTTVFSAIPPAANFAPVAGGQ